MTTSATLPAALVQGREVAEAALRAAVGRLDEGNRLVAFYHFGWSDAQGRPAAASSGKALRPILALLSARAARVPQDVGLPGAVSVELVHNFALLHDDLMDGDRERRHRATAWTVFGPARAILAGDAMLALAHQVLLEVPGPMGAAAARLLADTSQLLIRGQAEDLSFESRSEVSVDECLAMASGKTSALLACAAAVGAQLAGSEEIAVGLHQYGWHLGLAFQLVDDLLGIWGDPAETGKPVLSDLRKRKKSLPVTAALASGGPAAAELAEWLGRPTRTDPDDEAELRRIAALVETAGGRSWAHAEAERRSILATEALDGLNLPADVSADLQAVARFVTRRRD